MERPVITIPRSLLRELRMTWRTEWRGQDAGMSIGGNPLTVINAFPRWVGTPEVSLHRDAIRRWRALLAEGQGRLGIYRLPMTDPVGFDWNAAASAHVKLGVPFSNGAKFTTGQGIRYTPTVLAVGAVTSGAPEFRVDISPCGIAPAEGQIMSHDDWPFIVTWVDAVSETIYDIGVRMLRTAIPDGAEIMMQAHGRFEVVDEGQGDAPYDASRYTTAQLSVQEVLRR
ncbi:hypothetical protein [Pseudooceanicola sp.]|uniref:hypothetical protein n=1 Tax=Pseudooceanicola sp. TaxID=1914328 RepID=UPI0040583C12